MGSLAFYGNENGKKSGWGRDYYRARDSKEASDDPFAIHLEDQPDLKALYHDAEHVGGSPSISLSRQLVVLKRKSCPRLIPTVDNYHRDMNVFADDITIEDDMSVLVKYNTGATMTYHLTAYSVGCDSH